MKSPLSADAVAAWQRDHQGVYESVKAMVPRHDAYEVGYMFGYRSGYQAREAEHAAQLAERDRRIEALETALKRIAEPGCEGGYNEVIAVTSGMRIGEDRLYLTCPQVREHIAAGNLVYSETGYRILELERMCGACEATAALDGARHGDAGVDDAQ